MVEDVVTPTGPYRLRLMCRSGTWQGPLADGSTATAWQKPDGGVVVRAATAIMTILYPMSESPHPSWQALSQAMKKEWLRALGCQR